MEMKNIYTWVILGYFVNFVWCGVINEARPDGLVDVERALQNEEDCLLEGEEDNNSGNTLSDLHESFPAGSGKLINIKRKRCPRDRVGSAQIISQNKLKHPQVERRDIHNKVNAHLCSSCKNGPSCKLRNNCAVCEPWCGPEFNQISPQASEVVETVARPPAVPQTPIEQQESIVGSPFRPFSPIPQDSTPALAPQIIPPMFGRSNFVAASHKKTFNIDTNNIQPIKNVLLRLLGASNADDVEDMGVWVKTASNKAPSIGSTNYAEKIITLCKDAGTELQEEAQNKAKNLMASMWSQMREELIRRINQHDKIHLSREDIGKVIQGFFDDIDFNSVSSSPDTNSETLGLPGTQPTILSRYPIGSDPETFVMPQQLNPDVIEGPPVEDAVGAINTELMNDVTDEAKKTIRHDKHQESNNEPLPNKNLDDEIGLGQPSTLPESQSLDKIGSEAIGLMRDISEDVAEHGLNKMYGDVRNNVASPQAIDPNHQELPKLSEGPNLSERSGIMDSALSESRSVPSVESPQEKNLEDIRSQIIESGKEGIVAINNLEEPTSDNQQIVSTPLEVTDNLNNPLDSSAESREAKTHHTHKLNKHPGKFQHSKKIFGKHPHLEHSSYNHQPYFAKSSDRDEGRNDPAPEPPSFEGTENVRQTQQTIPMNSDDSNVDKEMKDPKSESGDTLIKQRNGASEKVDEAPARESEPESSDIITAEGPSIKDTMDEGQSQTINEANVQRSGFGDNAQFGSENLHKSIVPVRNSASSESLEKELTTGSQINPTENIQKKSPYLDVPKFEIDTKKEGSKGQAKFIPQTQLFEHTTMKNNNDFHSENVVGQPNESFGSTIQNKEDEDAKLGGINTEVGNNNNEAALGSFRTELREKAKEKYNKVKEALEKLRSTTKNLGKAIIAEPPNLIDDDDANDIPTTPNDSQIESNHIGEKLRQVPAVLLEKAEEKLASAEKRLDALENTNDDKQRTDSEVLGSQPLENSLELYSPPEAIPGKKEIMPKAEIPAKDETVVGTPQNHQPEEVMSNSSPATGGDENGNINIASRFNPGEKPRLSNSAGALIPADEITATNPKEVYFVGDGIKLPLNMVKKDDGALHLAVDLHRLCGCNSTCTHNKTTIEETVGDILEKEAVLKDQLSHSLASGGASPLQNFDGQNYEGTGLVAMKNNIASGFESAEMQHENPEILKRSVDNPKADVEIIKPVTVENSSQQDQQIIQTHDKNDKEKDQESTSATPSTTTPRQSLPLAGQSSSSFLKDFWSKNLGDISSRLPSVKTLNSLLLPQKRISSLTNPLSKELEKDFEKFKSETPVGLKALSSEQHKFPEISSQLQPQLPFFDSFPFSFTSPMFGLFPSSDNHKTEKKTEHYSITSNSYSHSTEIPNISSKIKSFFSGKSGENNENQDKVTKTRGPYQFKKSEKSTEQILRPFDEPAENYKKRNEEIVKEGALDLLKESERNTREEAGIVNNFMNWLKGVSLRNER